MNTKYEGISTYPSNFNINLGRPLDTRQVYKTLDQLTKPSEIGPYTYDGMIVAIPNNGLFMLNNSDVFQSKTDSTLTSDTVTIDDIKSYGWEKIATYTDLEEFTPKVQSQLKMYVYDIDENYDTTETTDVANIQIVRETNGTLTFEVEDTSTPKAEVLAGNSNTTINTTLQLNINDKKSDGTITPTTEVANVMVVRNVTSGKMSIRIS